MPTEYRDLYTRCGRRVGRPVARGTAAPAGCYFMAVELWLYRPDGQLLLCRRAKSCHVLPGYWGATTGGVQTGETSEQACLREAKEELGLTLSPTALQPVAQLLPHGDTLWDVYAAALTCPVGALTLQPEEVAAARWATTAEIRARAGQGQLYIYPELPWVLHKVKMQILSGQVDPRPLE